MQPEQDTLLANPYWSALTTSQAHLAIGGALARRFPAEVIPFAGIAEHTPAALDALAALLKPGESIYIAENKPIHHPRLAETLTLPGLQMLLPEDHPLPKRDPNLGIDALTEADIPAMIALKAVAFPGYFGPRAAGLGSFFGVHDSITGELIAMCGERLMLPGMREISALCTHPDHLGKGYAATLLTHLLHAHRAAGIRSFLGVIAKNTRAIELYHRLGFVDSRPLIWRRLAYR